jgi:hypothetical protein
MHVAFVTRLESLAKTWLCIGEFRQIPKTTNLGKRSPALPRGKVPQRKGLSNSLMVGSTIPYSPFERAVTHPKLNAMQYCYGVGSNFITGAPPGFEDLLMLRLCMKQKYNDQTVVYQNEVSHDQIFLIQYITKLPYVCV